MKLIKVLFLLFMLSPLLLKASEREPIKGTLKRISKESWTFTPDSSFMKDEITEGEFSDNCKWFAEEMRLGNSIGAFSCGRRSGKLELVCPDAYDFLHTGDICSQIIWAPGGLHRGTIQSHVSGRIFSFLLPHLQLGNQEGLCARSRGVRFKLVSSSDGKVWAVGPGFRFHLQA